MHKSSKQYGESDIKLKSSIFKSFRLKIVLYSLLSLVYTMLTIVAVFSICMVVYLAMGGELSLYERNHAQSRDMMIMNSVPVGNYTGAEITANNSMLSAGGHQDNSTIIILVICTLILAVVLFTFYFLNMMRKFSNYMDLLTDGIDEISHGNFGYKIDIHSNDEFGMIAEKMNHMTKDIDRIIEENKKGEHRKHELITSVAHDLRTPLTSVIGYLELLRSSQVDEETKQHYTEIVYQKSKRLEQLIEDLFSYTKYTYGNVASITQSVDLIKLIEQLLDEFYPSFEENHLTCQFYKDCSSLVSFADGNLLARAFANLIGNAIKYGAEGKKVELFFTHKSDEYKLVVKNYGAIIPEQDLPHIFERFYRVEDSRSRETGGSGLGLAIAKSIVHMHRGEIAAKSSLSGTVFEVRLPIINEPEKN